MTRYATRSVSIARRVIGVLTILNCLYAVGLAALLYAMFLGPSPVEALGFHRKPGLPQMIPAIRAIIAIGLVGAAIVHTVLRRLLAIVDTVLGGDPFVLANAGRLSAIAWSVMALELLRSVVAVIATSMMDWPGFVDGFSIASWFAVLLLFVLSSVFAQGARMRDDLEGTV
jgi:hypothetical protein